MARKSANLKVINAVLCEDVRQEIGNKRSLMGAFSGDIIAAEMPAHIQLALYVDFKRNNPDEEVALDVAFLVDDSQIVKFRAKLERGSECATLVIPKGIVQFDKDGVFSVKITPDNQKEEEILRKVVMAAKKGPTSSSPNG